MLSALNSHGTEIDRAQHYSETGAKLELCGGCPRADYEMQVRKKGKEEAPGRRGVLSSGWYAVQ